jgi:hypothetical protein
MEMEKEFGVIQGGLSPEEAEQRRSIFDEFKTSFRSTLEERGILHDFSLGKVFEEAVNGVTEFQDHEKEVYEKIKDLLEFPPAANDNRMPLPEDIKRAA